MKKIFSIFAVCLFFVSNTWAKEDKNEVFESILSFTGNFEEDLAVLPTGRRVALICVLVIFAPVFFCEEILEIVVDIIIDGGEE